MDDRPASASDRVVYRWDLDKTYLRTEFDTIRDLLRTAFESATQKRTIPGAAPLLRELQATSPYGIYIVSGSPEQLRKVLEAKLRLDGVRYDNLTLKPQLQNILRGRFRFIKDQVYYKLGALLQTRTEMPGPIHEVMFGDDAEADAFIYSLYSDICAGRISTAYLMEILRAAGTYEEDLPHLVRLASRAPRGDVARRIFIHLDRISSPSAFDDFGPRVCPFYNYFQPALVLHSLGFIGSLAALRVASQLVVQHGFTADALAASYDDLVRRHQVHPEAGARLVAACAQLVDGHFVQTSRILRHFGELLEERVSAVSEAPLPGESYEIDYVDLFRRDKLRAHRAKERLTGRILR